MEFEFFLTFKSVTDAKFEPSEVTFLRFMPSAVQYYYICFKNQGLYKMLYTMLNNTQW